MALDEGSAERRIVIPREEIARIRRHGEETWPEECCGLLLGADTGGERRIVECVAVRNEAPDRRGDNYFIAPEVVALETRNARRRGLDLLGFYHSHPGAPAEPSEQDLKEA